MTLNSTTDKPVALEFQIELEFGNVGFSEEGKTEVPGEKPLGARTRTNNKLNPHLTPSPRIEPGPHWWEACVGGKCSTKKVMVQTLAWLVDNWEFVTDASQSQDTHEDHLAASNMLEQRREEQERQQWERDRAEAGPSGAQENNRVEAGPSGPCQWL